MSRHGGTTLDNNLRKELEELGINVKAGIDAHMGNEAMFLRILKLVIMDEKFEELFEHEASSDAAPIFELSHSLKGTVGNVGLSEIDRLITDICETTRCGSLENVKDNIVIIKKMREQILHKIA